MAGLIRFELDPSTERPAHGPVLIGGSPLRLFRVTTAGERILDAIERGEPMPAGHERLTDRLLNAGAIHPVVDAAHAPLTARDVTVVVPAHHAPRKALASIVAAAGGADAVIVVDDASDPPVEAIDGARLVRLDTNVGPGGARLAGLAAATTALVAFVDADVVLPAGWLDGLLAHFADERLALVAPRVAARRGGIGVLARYDAERGPLDLGPRRGRVRAGSRIAYVPAAVLVCRRDALVAVGGFDPALRYGEDVDLVWRLDEAGWRCRYEPAVVVEHETRRTLPAWIAQRVAYGSSAAPLAARHRGALAPVRMSGWSLAAWVLVAFGHPLAGAGVAAGTTVALERVLADVPQHRHVARRIAGRGHLYAGRLLADALRRAWWPLLLAAMPLSRRARRIAIATVVPLVLDWFASSRRLDPARYAALRVLDDVAYGAGVWRGVMVTRSVDALLPELSNWPPRRPERDEAGYRRRR